MSACAGSGLGSLRAALFGALFACASALGCVTHAHAQSELVLLLVPQTPDPALVELFHRVEAELRLHDFRPEVLVASPGDSTETLLGAQASAQRAFAAIAIAEQTPFAMLHVWIVDARTGLTRQYRIEQQGGQEPTNVVAVRAVDLLRANRAAPPAFAPPPASKPPTAAGPGAAASGRTPSDGNSESRPTRKLAAAADGSTAAAAAQPTAAASERRRDDDGNAREAEPDAEREDSEERDASGDDADVEREANGAPSSSTPPFRYRPTLLQFAAEVTGLSLARRMGWSFGPSLGVWLTLGDRWRVGVVGVAPLWGADLRAARGDAAIWQELVWLELGARLLRAGPLQLSATAGAGLHWLQAKGQALAPYRSNNAATWSWTGSLAARADVMLAERWSLGLTLRARLFLPPVEVAVQSDSARLATPALEGALGLSLWL